MYLMVRRRSIPPIDGKEAEREDAPKRAARDGILIVLLVPIVLPSLGPRGAIEEVKGSPPFTTFSAYPAAGRRCSRPARR